MISRVRDTVNIENTLISTGVPYLVRETSGIATNKRPKKPATIKIYHVFYSDCPSLYSLIISFRDAVTSSR